MSHKNCCKNGCLRRMDVNKSGSGDFSYYKGTLDCPAQLELNDGYIDELEVIELCGCCSYDNGFDIKYPVDCRLRKGTGDWATCECHNTPIIYSTCLSKRNHGCCPYGLKGFQKVGR